MPLITIIINVWLKINTKVPLIHEISTVTNRQKMHILSVEKNIEDIKNLVKTSGFVFLFGLMTYQPFI